MKELIKELEESIYDCKIDAGDGGNNLDCVSDAIELLDKLKEAINCTLCCTEFETVSIDPDLQKSFNEYCNKQGKKEPIKKRF